MPKLRMTGMIGATVICALGIGYVMQALDGAEQPGPAAYNAPIEQSILPPLPVPAKTPEAPPLSKDDQAGLELDAVTLTAAAPDVAAPQPKPLAAEPEQTVADCAVSAQAATGAMAHVDISVVAPCFANDRVTVHHNGMMFTDVTDQNGELNLSVPALAERAVFIVAFANGKGAVATARVPDLGQYDRVAIQWTGQTSFQIHAREFGASYGDAGHVWSGAERLGANGSLVTRLGAADTLAPKLAEVYTFPTGHAGRSGTVALSIEAEVTDRNCGREVAAQSLELRGDAGLRTRDLVMSIPNCGAIGDFLVLNNLVDDLKIAAR